MKMKSGSTERIRSCVIVILSILCFSTAVRIEFWNHRAGGAIQKKAQYEPRSKWRIGDGFQEAYRQTEKKWRSENDFASDAELGLKEREEIRMKMKSVEWSPSARDRVGTLLESWGLAQYPLAGLLIFISMPVLLVLIGGEENGFSMLAP